MCIRSSSSSNSGECLPAIKLSIAIRGGLPLGKLKEDILSRVFNTSFEALSLNFHNLLRCLIKLKNLRHVNMMFFKSQVEVMKSKIRHSTSSEKHEVCEIISKLAIFTVTDTVFNTKMFKPQKNLETRLHDVNNDVAKITKRISIMV